MGGKRQDTAANGDCCNGTSCDGKQKTPTEPRVADLQKPAKAQIEIETVCHGVCEEVSADTPARQQKKQADYIQQIGQRIDPHTVDLLTEALVHAIDNAIEIQHRDQGRKQTQIKSGLAAAV